MFIKNLRLEGWGSCNSITQSGISTLNTEGNGWLFGWKISSVLLKYLSLAIWLVLSSLQGDMSSSESSWEYSPVWEACSFCGTLLYLLNLTAIFLWWACILSMSLLYTRGYPHLQWTPALWFVAELLVWLVVVPNGSSSSVSNLWRIWNEENNIVNVVSSEEVGSELMTFWSSQSCHTVGWYSCSYRWGSLILLFLVFFRLDFKLMMPLASKDLHSARSESVQYGHMHYTTHKSNKQTWQTDQDLILRELEQNI